MIPVWEFLRQIKKVKKYIYKIGILFLVIFIGQISFAYETVALKYPDNRGWHRSNYITGKTETIAQYTPGGQGATNFKEAVVYHSYKIKNPDARNAATLLKKKLATVVKTSKGMNMKPIKSNSSNAIYRWCAEDVNGQGAQCELVRATVTHEGVITIHYINKDKNDFDNKFNDWYDRVTKLKTYYNYYRTDHVLNKNTYFEL